MWHFLLPLNGKLQGIKNKRLSASIIQNTQSFLDNYTNELCQQEKLVLQKNRSLLSNMRENYKNCNEEQQMGLKYKIQIWDEHVIGISCTYIIYPSNFCFGLFLKTFFFLSEWIN